MSHVGTHTKTAPKFDPKLTQSVIDAIGPKTDDRTRFVMSKLIQHLHDFIREVELTPDEWISGVHFINSIGQISNSKRNEGQRMSDILGVESLVDEVANMIMLETDDIPTSSSILGPFYSPNAPLRDLGASIMQDPHQGKVALMHGVVTDLMTKKPIPNAVVEIWQAAANGKYDFQDPENQSDNNLRGKFKTDAEGKYWYYCLYPTAYSLPTDGPAWTLLKLLDRHPMRPAHIHLMITAEGYKPLVTQIYPRDDPWVSNDSVFAVKDDLLIDFYPSDDKNADLDLEYNVVLAPAAGRRSQAKIFGVFTAEGK